MLCILIPISTIPYDSKGFFPSYQKYNIRKHMITLGGQPTIMTVKNAVKTVCDEKSDVIKINVAMH